MTDHLTKVHFRDNWGNGEFPLELYKKLHGMSELNLNAADLKDPFESELKNSVHETHPILPASECKNKSNGRIDPTESAQNETVEDDSRRSNISSSILEVPPPATSSNIYSCVMENLMERAAKSNEHFGVNIHSIQKIPKLKIKKKFSSSTPKRLSIEDTLETLSSGTETR